MKSTREAIAMLHWFLDHFWELPVSLWLLPVCVVIAVVVGTAVAISSALRERKGGKWPVVDGRVVWQGFSQSPETETGYVAAVTYSYRVETGSGSEDYYDQFARGFLQEEDAEAWVNSLVGQPIPVHVRPGRPGESMVLWADLKSRFGCGRNR